jgi:demethylmenaquinone methyltransferase/2-methoxy-6-polyprenyl-1,4-benzoquinol methylase
MSNTQSGDLGQYYADRAREHDRVYEKPERQADLSHIREILPALLAGRRVLEVACGTGYWTQFVASRAAASLATDINEEVLDLARSRLAREKNVIVRREDAHRLESVSGTFDGAMACFWLSHLRRSDVAGFLSLLHSKLATGARVVFIDNRFVEGSSTPILRTDSDGNTYQRRTLDDRREYDVLKNFYAEEELRGLVAGMAGDVDVRLLAYYWCLSYTLD